MDDKRPLGVFDSGVGGLSVVGAIANVLPHEDIYYFGDTLNAPYGTKKPEEVFICTENVVHRLLEKNVKAIVIACNTATAAAAATLRQEYSLPIIGMEPALKPAHEMRHGGKILVMATPVTLNLGKFQALMEKYGEGAVPCKCPGLMEKVEALDFSGAREYLKKELAPFDMEHVDSIVLGCTHYVFLRDILREMLPDNVQIVDGNTGTANHLKNVLQDRSLIDTSGNGTITLDTSGTRNEALPVMEKLLEMAVNMFKISK